MITFSGYLTGTAERKFLQMARKQYAITLVIVFLSMSLAIIGIGRLVFKSDDFIKALMIALLAGTAICCLPKGKRARLALYPQLIYLEEGKITCVSESYTEVRFVQNVSKVVDYGSFYQIIFPHKMHSDKFVCQKDLLTRGSLKEFEALFDGKLERQVSK